MKTGTYDDFARATSYLLSEKARQRKERSESVEWGPVFLVQVPGHTFVILGDPEKDPQATVVDTWTADLHPHLWRDSPFFNSKLPDNGLSYKREITLENDFAGKEITQKEVDDCRKTYDFTATTPNIQNQKKKSLRK